MRIMLTVRKFGYRIPRTVKKNCMVLVTMATVLMVVYIAWYYGVYSTNLKNIEARIGTISYGPHHSSYINLILINTGMSAIYSRSQAISLYICFTRLVKESHEPSGARIISPHDVTVYHLDGCASKVVYNPPFRLAAGKSLSINMTHQCCSISYTDYNLNWYIQLGDGPHLLVDNTAHDPLDFVLPFDSPNKLKVNSNDPTHPLTLEERYADHAKSSEFDEFEVKTRLIPNILESFTVDKSTEYTEIYPETFTADDPAVTYSTNSTLLDGQFILRVERNCNILVSLPTHIGHTRKLVTNTVKQLLHRFSNRLPVGTLRSRVPRFGYRGFMLDIARHFHGKDVIKKQIKLMRQYNLNVLHLHLTDDESWALDIEGIPELAQYGSRQCFDLSVCATYPQLGRRIDSGRQFLTKSEYIEIVQFAESHGIQVIPEIDLPAHSTAAVQAMKIRYERSPTLTDYRLHDPEDTSEYLSIQSFSRGVVNPCLESTYAFIETVAKAIKSYHREAGQPLTILHMGGDEVSDNVWIGSPACQKLLFDLGWFKTDTAKVNSIKLSMLRRFGSMAKSFNISLAFWEDGLIDKLTDKPLIKDDIFPPAVEVYAFVWLTVWEWSGAARPYTMANDGYKVVLAPATRYYMDHSHEPHPKDRGFYWATRYVSLRKAFSFKPDSYYNNIHGKTGTGKVLKRAKFCNANRCPSLIKKENVVGVEAVLFGETVLTEDHMDNNLYPRLLAVADNAWTVANWQYLDGENPEGMQRDFDLFRHSIEKYEIPILEKLGVKYHLSPPGAVENKDDSGITLKFNTEFNGQRVWYQPNGSKSWTEAPDLILRLGNDLKTLYIKSSNTAGTRYSYPVVYHGSKDSLKQYEQDLL